MKNIILSAIVMAFIMVSCNQKNKEEVTNATESSSQLYACSMHPEIKGKKGEECSKCGMELTEPVATESSTTENAIKATTKKNNSSFSIEAILNDYLKMKNALTKDDSNGAADAGKALVEVLAKLDMKKMSGEQMKSYMEIADDTKENAEHIGDNAGKLDHQREHFVLLSKDINDLITTFGTKQNLYQDFCPMADEGNGAIWISEIKEIKNPYLGTKMPTCGSMKKSL